MTGAIRPCHVFLFDRFQHIFDEDSIPGGWVINEHMGHSSYELSVLNDGRAAHKCGQERTTNFVIFLIEFDALSSS